MKHLLSGPAADRYRRGVRWLRAARSLALVTFLVPFSALGAYVQYEKGTPCSW